MRASQAFLNGPRCRPPRARVFFEALVPDNPDVGRPDEIRIVFD